MRKRKTADWDIKVRAPIVEGPALEFDSIGLEEEGGGIPRLQRLYEQEPVDRLRLIDSDGALYDVLDLGPKGIGVEPIAVSLSYRGITPYLTWEDAENALPKKWEEYHRVRASRNASEILERVAKCLTF